MSRAEKQLRRKLRKQHRNRRTSWGRRTISPLDRDFPQIVRLCEYDITWEPIGSLEEHEPELDAAMGNRRQQLFEWTHDSPHRAIPLLESLFQDFPNSRTLMNWLTAAYQRIGAEEKANRMILICHERHPSYLFARVNLAALHLERGEIRQAEAVMGMKWDLKLMYPQRKVFHISEFMAMGQIAVEYYSLTGNSQAAKLVFQAIEAIAPDCEVTDRLRRNLQGATLFQSLRRLAGWTSRQRTPPNSLPFPRLSK